MTLRHILIHHNIIAYAKEKSTRGTWRRMADLYFPEGYVMVNSIKIYVWTV